MKTNAEAGQFTKQDLDAAVSNTFIPINSSPMGRYISKISFGDYYDDLESFRLIPEGKDKFGYTSYDVRLKLKSGKEYTLKDRYDEQGQSEQQRPNSGKLVFELDKKPYSDTKGLYTASSYVLEADRAADVKFKTENPRGTSDYTESDSRWGMRFYNFRKGPGAGRAEGPESIFGDIPFSGRQSFGMNPKQLFINGFPVDEEGNRITPGGSDARYGDIGVSIGTRPIDYDDPNKTPIQTPLVNVGSGYRPGSPGSSTEGKGYFDELVTAPAKVYTARDGLEFTDQMAFATYQTGLSAEQRALAAETRAGADAEVKLKEAEFQKQLKNENALVSLTALFEKYGLSTLVPKLKELVVAGYSDDTVEIQLSQTEEYQQRFRANKERLKKGLSVLDPATYIGLEDKYRQVLKAYGLKQFDNDDYVNQFLENNTSVDEVASRISLAVDRVKFADPMIMETLRTYYPNINDTDLVAYMLDPENEQPKLERQVQAAEVTAAARMQGLTPGKQYAEELVGQGVTKAQAQKGYATIADILPTAEKLSDIYGTTLPGYGQVEAEQEVFNTLASAQRKRRALAEREIAEFGGASGLSRGALGKQTGGQY